MSAFAFATTAPLAFLAGMLLTGVLCLSQDTPRWVHGPMITAPILCLIYVVAYRSLSNATGVGEIVFLLFSVITLLTLLSGLGAVLKVLSTGPAQVPAMVTVVFGAVAAVALALFLMGA